MCAKHYENPTMLSRVTAKNVGDVFLRHTVYADDTQLHALLSLTDMHATDPCGTLV